MTIEHTASDMFRKYYGELCRYVQNKFSRAGEADDIVQDAFQNILNLGSIQSIENPRAYLYRTATNIALNHMRRQDRQYDYINDIDESEPLSVPMDRQFIAEREVSRVNRAIQTLSQKDRTTFLLNRLDGKSYQEISQELGISVSSVEKRMMKALSVLRRAIDER